MNCRAGYCEHKSTCSDVLCEGHPCNTLIQFDGGGSIDTDDTPNLMLLLTALCGLLAVVCVAGAFAWFVYYSAPIILAALPFH